MKATTHHPALVVFVIDASHSTGATWVIDGKSGAEETVAATLESSVNRALHDLVVNVCYHDGEVKDRVCLSVLKVHGSEPVWGLEGEAPHEGWFTAGEWAVMAPQPQHSGEPPQWVSLSPSGKTPWMEGWHRAFDGIERFVAQHPESSVLLVSLTDGSFTELNLGDDDVDGMIQRQSSIAKQHTLVHLIGHISASGLEPMAFPTQRPENEERAFLFDFASQLPPHLFEHQQPTLGGVDILPNSKAYVHNADHGMLSGLIQLGSRFIDGHLRKTLGEEE